MELRSWLQGREAFPQYLSTTQLPVPALASAVGCTAAAGPNADANALRIRAGGVRAGNPEGTSKSGHILTPV